MSQPGRSIRPIGGISNTRRRAVVLPDRSAKTHKVHVSAVNARGCTLRVICAGQEIMTLPLVEEFPGREFKLELPKPLSREAKLELSVDGPATGFVTAVIYRE